MRQPALMGLGHIIAQARDQSGVDQPTNDEVANACRECIANACEHWTERPDSPDIARLLLGVARGSRGATRKVRRERIEGLYGAKVEWLTHKREGSSPETRAIEVIAGALADSEHEHQKELDAESPYVGLEHIDFISPIIGADFRCLAYQADLSLLGGECWLDRRLTLVSLRRGARLCEFHDGWGSAVTSFSCKVAEEFDGMPSVTIEKPAMNTPTLPLELRKEFMNNEELDLHLVTGYKWEFEWGARYDHSFGFFANPDSLAVPCYLRVELLDSEKVTTQTAIHRRDTRIEESKEHPGVGNHFELHSAVLPGTSYSLHWQTTPQEPETDAPENNYWEENYFPDLDKNYRPKVDK